MAKKKTPHPKTQQLKRYYRIGRKAVQKTSNADGVYAKGVISDLAEEEDLPEVTVDKCRQFAQLYDQAEFDELCSLRMPNGNPFGWGHVTKLLPVKLKRSRLSLQRQAAKHGWSTRQLEDEAREKPKAKTTRGRRHPQLQSQKEAYRKIASMADAWLRWHGDFETTDAIGLSDMPEDAQKKIKSVERAIRKLGEEVEGFL